MSIPLTKQMADYSDKESFCFGFLCDRCGKEWHSRQVILGQKKGLRKEKRQMAFEQANLEARLHFNLCPLCGKWVCDDCFCPDEVEHGGVCKNCY